MGLLMDDFKKGENKKPLPRSVGTFDWYTKAKDILPEEWKLMDEGASDRINIHDMLSHATGMPRSDMSRRS